LLAEQGGEDPLLDRRDGIRPRDLTAVDAKLGQPLALQLARVAPATFARYSGKVMVDPCLSTSCCSREVRGDGIVPLDHRAVRHHDPHVVVSVRHLC
jgi:hypothetical protein